jgi:hypothetical protein
MEIATLKQLKKALNKIPDKELAHMGVGIDPEAVRDYITLLYWGDKDPYLEYCRIENKYPVLADISNYIEALGMEQKKYDELDEGFDMDERESPVSSKERVDEG